MTNFVCGGITVMVLLFGLTAAVYGQDDQGEVHVGLKGGFGIPKLVGSGDEEITRDYKSRFTYNFGGFVEFRVTPRFSVQTGVDYSPQGGTRNGIQPITSPIPGLPPLPGGAYYYADFENTANLKYLEVPVLFNYTQRRNSGPSFYLNAGPYAGYLIKATQVTRGTSTIFLDSSGTPLLLPPAGTPFPPIPFDADTDIGTASIDSILD